MSKKRIRIEFTVVTDSEGKQWRLDKKLLALRMMLKTNLGTEALVVFQQWLEQTTENPNYIIEEAPKKKRVGGRVR